MDKYHFIVTHNEILMNMAKHILTKNSPFFCHDSQYPYKFPQRDNLPAMPLDLMSTEEMLTEFDNYEKNQSESKRELESKPEPESGRESEPESRRELESKQKLTTYPPTDDCITLSTIDEIGAPAPVITEASIEIDIYNIIRNATKYCNICQKNFKTGKEKDNHDNRKHYKNETHLCNIAGCDKKYTTISSLKLHKLRNHTEKKYKCKTCNKRYSLMGDLTKHIKSCKGIKYYY